MRDYKIYKWSDVLTIINGKNQSAVECEDGEYPIYGSGGIMGKANDFLCPPNCTIIGRKGNINKPIFVETKFWNVDTAFGLSANEELLTPRYLYYFCVDYNFERHNKAVTIPSLTKADLLKIEICLPSLSQQKSIVEELDKINLLIDLKRKQLEIYDKLAQSLFYETFGDPVENEKGWEVKKVSEICSVYGRIGFRGYTKADFVESSEEGAISLSPTNIINNTMDFNKCSYVTWDKYNESPEIKARIGDILLVKTGSSYGKCALITELPHKATINPQFVIIKDCKINNRYLHYYLCSEAAKINYDNFVIGTAVPTFSQKNLNNMKVLVPPLPLQQTFANRIEAIEKQKANVKRAIEKLETLLSSRMDYWFVIQPVAEQIVENAMTEDNIKEIYNEYKQGNDIQDGTIHYDNGHPRGCTDNNMDFRLLADIYNYMKDSGETSIESVKERYSYTSHAKDCVLELKELGLLSSDDLKTFHIV